MRRLGLLLLPLLLAACEGDADPMRGVSENEVLLQVAAVGRSEAAPDEARFTAGVETTGATSRAASEANAAAMTRLMTALTAQGIPAEDVQTKALSLNRVEYGPDRGRYRASNLAEVRVRDMAKAGAVVSAAVEAGGNLVSGPELRVSSQEEADNKAYGEAYKAARARADAYAAAAGLKVRRTLAIRDGAVDGPPIGYGYEAAAVGAVAQSANAAPFRPGTNVREVRVRADFALGR